MTKVIAMMEENFLLRSNILAWKQTMETKSRFASERTWSWIFLTVFIVSVFSFVNFFYRDLFRLLFDSKTFLIFSLPVISCLWFRELIQRADRKYFSLYIRNASLFMTLWMKETLPNRTLIIFVHRRKK